MSNLNMGKWETEVSVEIVKINTNAKKNLFKARGDVYVMIFFNY